MKFATDAEARAYKLGAEAAYRSQQVTPPPPSFRKNAKGQPEYASIILTLDHLMENTSGHVNTKMVLSTEDVETALHSLWEYYGETSSILSMKSTLDQMVEYRMAPDRGIFLYVTKDVTDRFGGLRLEVVMSTDLFSALSMHPNFGDGSEFVLIQKLTEQFAQVLAVVNKSRGGEFPPLTFLGLEGQLAVVQPVADQKGEAKES